MGKLQYTNEGRGNHAVQNLVVSTNRVVLMQVEGLLITPEVQSLIADSGSYVANGTPLVHFLVDTRSLQKIESVPEALKVVQGNPPHSNMGWMVVVGKMNPLVKFFLDFVGLLTK